MKKLFLLLVLSFLSLTLAAQVKVSDHLSNPEVTCFEQDKHGRMWIGTSYGLNRFNGNDFHQYFGETIPGNRIESILCDSRGRVWIGTDNGVASYSDSKGFTKYEVRSQMKKVTQIVESADGRIFLNLIEDLCVLDTISCAFVPAIEFFDRYFQYHQNMYSTPDSLLWVVGAAEIRCFKTATMENVDNLPTPVPALVSDMFPNGRILFGEGTSLFMFDCKTWACNRLDVKLDREISLIKRITDNTAIIKTVDGQLLLFDASSLQITPWAVDIDSRFNVTCVSPDSNGNIWLGSSDDGYYIRKANTGRFDTDRRILKAFEGHSVYAVDIDSNGRIWAYTGDQGIMVYEPQSGTAVKAIISGITTARNDILQKNTPSLMVDSKDNIWFFLPDQRKLYSGKWKNPALHITAEYDTYYPHCFLESTDGSIWCGLRNESAIRLQNGLVRTFQIYPWNSSETRDIISFGDYLLLAAYNDHLTLLKKDDCSVSHLPINSGSEKSISRNGLFDPSIMTLDKDKIWIGTRNTGLLVYDIQNKSLYKEPSVPNDRICAMETDHNGDLWMSSPDGLIHKDKFGSVQLFSQDDGLTGTCFYEASSCSMPDGTILFGGTHGITQVNPEWKEEPFTGDFTFEDISLVSDRIIDISGIRNITLNHNENSFSISFISVALTNEVKQNYSYTLEGFDKTWSHPNNENIAYYSNLEPGSYSFKVKTNGSVHSFDIRIKAPFLLSWWMISFYAILILALCIWVWNSRRQIVESKHTAKVNEMNMRFFTNISHEFRTPLTMISGPAEQLSNDVELTGKQRDLVNVMQLSINRMLTLVNQLLELGKIENDTLKLQASSTDIVPIVKLICEPFRHQLEQAGSVLNLVLESNSIIAMTDDDKLQKILNNLLSNAVKYTPQGGIVTVTVGRDKGEIVISVGDTGPGVAADKLEKIFERYYQIGKNSKDKVNYSTGIGLYYARALAKVHHGSLVAANKAEGGLVVTYRFPYDPAAYTSAELNVSQELSNNPVETLPGLVSIPQYQDSENAKVLIIDDDKDLLSYMSSLLGAKYHIITSTNAQEALTMARSDAPDVILSDVMMPGMNGLELCRDIKNDMILSHIPVILVTAKGTVDNQVEGLQYGADAYVTKPFSPSYLMALVKAQIDNHQKIRQLINSSIGKDSFEDSGLPAKDALFMKEVYSRMDSVLDKEGIDISDIAEQMGVSRSKFYYKIKALTGKTPSDFMMQYRLNIAANMLKEGNKNVSEVAFSVGFSTLPHFSRCFKNQFGVSPSKYA